MNTRLARAAALLLAGALALACPPRAAAAELVRVGGVVLDRAGHPIEFAVVACPALKTGAAADDQGRFVIELPPGRAVLEVSQLGYEKARLEVRVAAGLAPLRVVLGDAPLELAEVQVATSSFGKVGTGEGATLRRMDVYTTPGGAADVMQSLRALPGINAPNEGAAVYVRGGDPSETLIRLDGAEVGHPYHYEGASGGLFSALDAYLVRGAFFSSGGFTARYGRVLSGVLDVDTQDPGEGKSVNVGLNMVGANVSGSFGLVPRRLGLIGSLRYSDTGPLLDLYGTAEDYVDSPISHDAAAKLVWKPGGATRVTLTVLHDGDRSKLFANALNVYALYHEDAANTLGALDAGSAFGEHLAWHLRGTWQRYRAGWTYADFGTTRDESVLQGALQAVWTPHPRHELTFGGDLPSRAVHISGTLPADSVDIGPGAPLRGYDLRPVLTTPGAFVEDKLRLWGPLYATLGMRVDRASNAGVWTADPRAALAWRVDDHQTVRVATGRYHQPADARQLDATYGNPALGPLRADHVIAGYEWLSDNADLRVEAFRKDYRDLVTVDSLAFYANGGSGFARGVDVFLKGSHRWTSGWISYGYLDSQRREGDDPRLLPAAQGVKHSLTLVGSYQWSGAWILGVRYGWSSGPPWTPVAGRVWDPARGVWRPVYAENRSARMPAYQRLDVRMTRLFTIPRALGLPTSAPCAAYIEGLNVLDIRNVLEYVYNSDWSERYARDSYFSRRMLVAGMSLTW